MQQSGEMADTNVGAKMKRPGKFQKVRKAEVHNPYSQSFEAGFEYETMQVSWSSF